MYAVGTLVVQDLTINLWWQRQDEIGPCQGVEASWTMVVGSRGRRNLCRRLQLQRECSKGSLEDSSWFCQGWRWRRPICLLPIGGRLHSAPSRTVNVRPSEEGIDVGDSPLRNAVLRFALLTECVPTPMHKCNIQPSSWTLHPFWQVSGATI